MLDNNPDLPLEGAEEIAAIWYETPAPTKDQIRRTRHRLAHGQLKAGRMGALYVSTVGGIRAQKARMASGEAG